MDGWGGKAGESKCESDEVVVGQGREGATCGIKDARVESNPVRDIRFRNFKAEADMHGR